MKQFRLATLMTVTVVVGILIGFDLDPTFEVIAKGHPLSFDAVSYGWPFMCYARFSRAGKLLKTEFWLKPALYNLVAHALLLGAVFYLTERCLGSRRRQAPATSSPPSPTPHTALRSAYASPPTGE